MVPPGAFLTAQPWSRGEAHESARAPPVFFELNLACLVLVETELCPQLSGPSSSSLVPSSPVQTLIKTSFSGRYGCFCSPPLRKTISVVCLESEFV